MATYRKLPGQSRSLADHSRLWLGEDHLLLVTSSGYSEEYRRFFFSDIQAFHIFKTRHGAVLNAVFGGLAILFGALGFGVPNAEALFLWTVALICAATVAINTALGPTCSVQVQTTIARHPLTPLGRLRRARKVLARLRPLIVAAQGELDPERLAEITVSRENIPVPTVLGA
jgi:hypothetical protein